MAMALTLPAFVLLKSKSNGRYLCPVVDDEQGYGSLQFSGKSVFGPEAKYEVEATLDGLVHIRCCYNNKYWVRWSEADHRIAALATEPEGERSKWSCTLFEPILKDEQTVWFRHVQLGRYVSVDSTSDCSLCVASTKQGREEEKEIEFAFINGESLLMLPKYVVFKGDNGCYLRISQIEDRPHMQFASSDKGDPAAMNEAFFTDDGCVRIKCRCDKFLSGSGKFWRRDPKANWIRADSDENDPHGNDLFRPVKIDNKVIALRNQGNSLFCRRLTDKGKTDCLSAAVDGITKEAHLEVEEPVVSRAITNVKFRPTDSRIRTKKPVTLALEEITNKSPTESQTEELTFSYAKSESSTWSSTVSLKLGVQTTIRAGIPSILKGKIEISGEHSRSIQWGNMEQSAMVIETKNKVTIPPRHTLKVSVSARKGSFEVPFSYTQSDTLTNGDQVTTNYDDGVYIGVEYFDFQHETVQIPLK